MSQPRILAVGAHPDDCDVKAGGTAILWARAGCAVRFLSVTCGDAGHHELWGAPLALRRKAEAQAAARSAGISYVVLDFPDARLEPTLEARLALMREIRAFQPDLILTHRPFDYHPDHRYTSQLVQDCCFTAVVPAVLPGVPALRNNPSAMYFSDHFQKPLPFNPAAAVDIGPVFENKVEMLACHESQFFEWLPWLDGKLAQVPADRAGRLAMLRQAATRRDRPSPAALEALARLAGQESAARAQVVESFEICEYGAPIEAQRLRWLFLTEEKA